VSALIVVDLDRLRPEIDGRWHRTNLRQMPTPGETVTTLCGRAEPAVYGTVADRAPVRLTCWDCDLMFRRAQGLPIRRAEVS
jgi:hypothetical protein